MSVLRPVGSQAYQLEPPKCWRIHDGFHVSLLEKKTTRREWIEQTIEDQLEFEDEDEKERSALFFFKHFIKLQKVRQVR